MTRKISPQPDGCRAESLTAPARQVHQAALAEFARAGQPPARSDLEQLARSLGTSPDAVLAELASADMIAFSPGGQIRAAFVPPFPAARADAHGQVLDQYADVEKARRNFGPRRHGRSGKASGAFLRHAYVHGGAGAALSRAAPPHRVVVLLGAPVRQRLRAVPATHPQPGFGRFPSQIIDAI